MQDVSRIYRENRVEVVRSIAKSRVHYLGKIAHI